MSQAFSDFHLRFPRLRPPQAVTAGMAAHTAAAVEGHDERVLLLGVTPALSGIGRELVAVDRSPKMIALVWLGDDERRRVVGADWRWMDPGGDFSAVVGDGSLNCVAYPAGYEQVLARLTVVLRRPARFAVRFFVTPDPCESVEALGAATIAGQVESIHALKWRLAMAIVAERGDVNIAAVDILARFDALFPDRTELMCRTGWTMDEIGTLDFYRGSSDVLSFPTVEQIRAVVPPGFSELRLMKSGDYDLSERCPVVVMDWTGGQSDF
jgi:hypothetical protein